MLQDAWMALLFYITFRSSWISRIRRPVTADIWTYIHMPFLTGCKPRNYILKQWHKVIGNPTEYAAKFSFKQTKISASFSNSVTAQGMPCVTTFSVFILYLQGSEIHVQTVRTCVVAANQGDSIVCYWDREVGDVRQEAGRDLRTRLQFTGTGFLPPFHCFIFETPLQKAVLLSCSDERFRARYCSRNLRSVTSRPGKFSKSSLCATDILVVIFTPM